MEQGITLPGGQLAPGQSAIPFVPPSVEELRAWYEFEDNVTVIDNAKAKIKRLMATSNVPNIVKPISKQTLRTLSYEAGLPFISTKAEMCQNLVRPAYGGISCVTLTRHRLDRLFQRSIGTIIQAHTSGCRKIGDLGINRCSVLSGDGRRPLGGRSSGHGTDHSPTMVQTCTKKCGGR